MQVRTAAGLRFDPAEAGAAGPAAPTRSTTKLLPIGLAAAGLAAAGLAALSLAAARLLLTGLFLVVTLATRLAALALPALLATTLIGLIRHVILLTKFPATLPATHFQQCEGHYLRRRNLGSACKSVGGFLTNDQAGFPQNMQRPYTDCAERSDDA
jgi:hypothetical protein